MLLPVRPDHASSEPVALAAALQALDIAASGLITIVESGILDQLGPHDKVSLWQRVEQIRNRMPLIDHVLIADAERSGLANEFCYPSVTMMLSKALRLSPGEAASRVRAAQAVGRRDSMLGQPLPPLLPMLAEAQRGGEVTPEQVGVIERAVDRLSRPGLDPSVIAEADEVLTEHARSLGPRDLRLLARRLVDAADPDGPQPDEGAQLSRRHLELVRLRDGMWRIEGRLTAAAGCQLHAVLGPLSKPQPLRIDDAAGVAPGTDEVTGGTPSSTDGTRRTTEPDPRHHGQRLHDALEAISARLLQSWDVPDTGGIPATVIVTIPLQDLLNGTGQAETADGSLVDVTTLMRIADEAEIWPTVITPHGRPLWLGRSRRIASRTQTLALVARDGGCTFPGCDRPPQWCDRHHVTEWIAGGVTDLDNLTLLCRYHHTHFAQRGWTCRMSAQGLPEWIPPRWIDRDQRPLLHERIRRRQTEHALR